MLKLIAFVLVLGLAVTAKAQSLSPITTECSGKCSGSFLIQNQSLQPMQFAIEAYSVHWQQNASAPSQTPLDPTVTVKLSQSSGRLGPKETREIGFAIHCDVLPCTVQLLNGFITGHTVNGLAIRLILPFTAYLDLKAKGARMRILTAAGVVAPELRK